MTYLQIINLIKDTALAQPNVNSVVREFLDLNREDAKYSAVVIQDRDGSRDRIVEQDYVTYTWHLGYVDRLTYDESNRDDIISTGINIINNIVNTIRNTWFPELEVSIVDRINTFDQRFTAQCAGVYVVLAVNAQVSDCVDSESTDLYDTYDTKITANGVYHFVPSGRPVDEINIVVNVESQYKPEDSLVKTITSNGSYSYTPEEGRVFSDADITVDVHPTESLSRTYTSNGNYDITGEFNGGVVTVNVPESVIGFTQKEITEGTIEIINLDNSASFVASSVFMNNTTIQTVNLPYATSVGNSAFKYCYSLTQVSLPVCKSIGNSAFYECSSLSQVNLPMCEYIDDRAFNGCSSLSQVNLPMCSYIGNGVFGFCSSLSQVNLPMCKNVNTNAFYGCRLLTSIDLPMCNYIGQQTFNDCPSLSQVNLPMCENIGNYTFRNCYSLSQISLPVCKYIYDYAFWFCSSFNIITIGYSGVCNLNNSNAFSKTQITSSTGSIYVPTSLVDAYKSATNWSYFSTQIFPIPE